MIGTYLYRGFLVSLFCTLIGCQTEKLPSQSTVGERSQETLSREALLRVAPVNVTQYRQQIAAIKRTSPLLYREHRMLYESIETWLRCVEASCSNPFPITIRPLGNTEALEKTRLTGYYTPVLDAREHADDTFRYPLYRLPESTRKGLPTREAIYGGALKARGLEIGYTRSLLDNFILQVQGSGYVDFGDGKTVRYFAFAGKNGYPYQSIGRLLVEQGEIPKESMSMQAIKDWADKADESTLLSLLKQNQSFVFFKSQPFMPISGSAGVPLIANAAVASDRAHLPTGIVVLARVPLLRANGTKAGVNEWRLLVALDTGSAICGNHLDLYQGIGEQAGKIAGYYNHYAPVFQFMPVSNERK